MSLMYGDRIKITTVDMNNELKIATKEKIYSLKAHVENTNILLTGFNGTVVSAYTRIFIPNRKVMQDGQLRNMEIKKGDMLSIIKLQGQTLIESEQTARPIIEISRLGFYKNRHLQVLL